MDDNELEFSYSNADICYECSGYGDDYYIDENGEWACACWDCPYSEDNWDEDN